MDARIVEKRKYYLQVCGMICTLAQYIVGLNIIQNPFWVCMMLVTYNLSGAMMDVTVESIVV